MPKVYIILVNYNNWFSTIQCLESILKNSYGNYQIILVDNASEDSSVDYIKKWAEGKINIFIPFFPNDKIKSLFFPVSKKPVDYKIIEIEKNFKIKDEKLIIVKNKKNVGFSGGVNTGLSIALENNDFKYIWILNNDTVISKDSLIHLVKTMESKSDIGILGSKILYYEKPKTIQILGGGKFNLLTGIPEQTGNKEKDKEINTEIFLEHVMGASMFVRKEVIENIGLFNESFFLYLEDTEWSIRAKKAGWKLFCEPKSVIWHKDGDTSGSKSHYYFVRNGLFFVKENFPEKFIFMFVYGLYRYTFPKILKGKWYEFKLTLKAYIDFLRGKKGKLDE